MIEIASPANKDRPSSVKAFVAKAVDFLGCGVHLLLVDLFAPGRHDPDGLHGAIWDALGGDPPGSDSEPGKPLRLASYLAGALPEAFVEPVAVGDPLPDMPLFLDADHHVNVPLAATYEAAWRGVPEVWKRVVEGR